MAADPQAMLAFKHSQLKERVRATPSHPTSFPSPPEFVEPSPLLVCWQHGSISRAIAGPPRRTTRETHRLSRAASPRTRYRVLRHYPPCTISRPRSPPLPAISGGEISNLRHHLIALLLLWLPPTTSAPDTLTGTPSC